MKLSRRLVIAGSAVMSAFLLPGCSADGAGDPATGSPTVPSDWATDVMEPLTIRVPADLTPWSQASGSASFYWDRAWSTAPEELGTSTVLLARLWGPGAAQDVSAAQAVQSLAKITGVSPATGKVNELGDGSLWQELSGSSAKGAVWDLTNGMSRAIAVLFGPEVDDALIASVGAGLALDEEAEMPALAAGWQRRQANGVSVAVGASWNDVGQPEMGGDVGVWQRGWTRRVDEAGLPVGAVMVGANLAGASVTEAASAVLVAPGVTALRDTVTTAFATENIEEGQRVDFTWGNGASHAGSLWVARGEETIDGVMYLYWSGPDETFVAARGVIEASIAAV